MDRVIEKIDDLTVLLIFKHIGQNDNVLSKYKDQWWGKWKYKVLKTLTESKDNNAEGLKVLNIHHWVKIITF